MWMTGGSYDPAVVKPLHFVLLFPMIGAAKAGLSPNAALVVAFLVYFSAVFLVLYGICERERGK